MKIAQITIAIVLTGFPILAQQPTPSQTPETLQILEKVNSFYSSSFSQLVTLSLAFLAFAGVILPVIIQVIQTRIFRIEHKGLQSQIAADISDIKSGLIAEIEKKFQAEKEEFKKALTDETKILTDKLDKQVLLAKGGAFFLQGKVNSNQGDHSAAARDYAFAGAMLLRAKDELNGQRALQVLVERSLLKLDKTSFDKVSDLDRGLEALLKTLQSNNSNNRFSDTIRLITKEVSDAKRRAEPALQKTDEKKKGAESAPRTPPS